MLMRFAFAVLAASLALNLLLAVADPGWLIVPAALAGWYVADLASGLVHMTMDYWPSRRGVGLNQLYFYEGSRESDDYQLRFRRAMAKLNPVERLVYDFKNHHPRPDALGRRTMTRQIGSTVIAGTLPLSLILNFAAFLWPVPGWAIAGGVALLLGGTFAQFFHGTLHRSDVPPAIAAMRRLRLLMTPAAHQLHHDTLKRDFSTNCGWSNPLVNRVFALAYGRGWLRDEGLEPRA